MPAVWLHAGFSCCLQSCEAALLGYQRWQRLLEMTALISLDWKIKHRRNKACQIMFSVCCIRICSLIYLGAHCCVKSRHWGNSRTGQKVPHHCLPLLIKSRTKCSVSIWMCRLNAYKCFRSPDNLLAYTSVCIQGQESDSVCMSLNRQCTCWKETLRSLFHQADEVCDAM